MAIYDPDRRDVLLFHNRLGVKTLYWLFDMSRLAFASEIKARLAKVERSVRPNGRAPVIHLRPDPSPRSP